MKITNEIVEDKAKKLGFDLVGFAKAEILEEESFRLEEWLNKNYQGGMKYMERNIDKRKDIRKVFPEAKSVISLALNYYTPAQHSVGNIHEQPDNSDLSSNNAYVQKSPSKHLLRKAGPQKGKSDYPAGQTNLQSGKLSRYAWGKDYHLIMWNKLEILERQLSEIDPEFKSLSYVDTGPVMDKVWAVRAGLGWQGKHTNIINPEIGSWFFIATIITNYEFGESKLITDHCGSCTACIEACPTNAIIDEYVVDSNKCISYLTIENKSEIPKEFKGKFDGWMFGCDICQDVCPWNIKFSEVCDIAEFSPAGGETEISLESIKEMDDKIFKKRFAESPIKRTKLKGLKRNADFLMTEEKP